MSDNSPARPTFGFSPYGSPTPQPGPSFFTTTPADDPIGEGRRISLRNLDITVRRSDIEAALKDAGINIHEYDPIRIPVDPISGRNRDHCSVTFLTREGATAVLEKGLKIQNQGRPLEVGRFETQKLGSDRLAKTFALAGVVAGERQQKEDEQRRSDIMLRLAGLEQLEVPSTPKGQEQHKSQVRKYFKYEGLQLNAVSNRSVLPPYDPAEGFHCFVFFETEEDARLAIERLDGKEIASLSMNMMNMSGGKVMYKRVPLQLTWSKPWE